MLILTLIFSRDNIDIDLDVENKILENIDIDIEPKFDIVPCLLTRGFV